MSSIPYGNLLAGTYYGYAKDAGGCTGRSTAIVLSAPVGCSTFSRMASADENNEKQNFEVVLSPNPSTTKFTLTVFSAKKEAVQMRVMDTNGRVVLHDKRLSRSGFEIWQ